MNDGLEVENGLIEVENGLELVDKELGGVGTWNF